MFVPRTKGDRWRPSSKLTPAPAAVESDEPARNITTVIGIQSMQTVAGVPRGQVEAVLGHLAALPREFSEPAKPEREAGAA